MSAKYTSGLVSVIMPAYNSQYTIIESLSSVLEQSYSNWELIICDDGSVDETKSSVLEFLARYPDSRVKLIDNKNNKGAAGARNSALEVAKGQFIAFLDADDVWLSEKLMTQVLFMQESGSPFT